MFKAQGQENDPGSCRGHMYKGLTLCEHDFTFFFIIRICFITALKPSVTVALVVAIVVTILMQSESFT